jgi:sugar phosphate isomerase/epimerase
LADLARLSLNQATVREQCSLRQAIELCARHSAPAIAPWRDKLAECGVAEAKRLIDGHGLAVSSLCRAGVFTADSQDENRRAIDEAAALGAQCLVIVAGGLAAGSKDLAGAHARIAHGVAELLPHARAAGVTLAIEPLHPMYAADRCCVNTLRHALDLCDALGEGAGVAVDVYHTWWDPELEAQVARAGRRIVAFHVCDWLVPTRDLLLDRGMMGDGVIDIAKIRGWVERAGYAGPIEVEIFSAETWWRKPADEVMRTCVERFARYV